tara:strand:+ start:8944 stop:9741 length:798 start_codon:yes stop_codon:yes gene_type:complete
MAQVKSKVKRGNNMLKTNFVKTGLVAAGIASALAFSPVSNAYIASYSQDFEGMTTTDPTALSTDGWLVGANVFSPDGTTFLYNYFAFPAPNGGPGFSGIATNEGGPAQGLNQLNTYSDYNNGDQAVGNIISANLFRDLGTLTGEDVGRTFTFSWDIKQANQEPPSTSEVFLKVLTPSFAEVAFASVDTTASGVVWGNGSSSVTIQPDWVGNFFQMGFVNNASNYKGSGVLYDNLSVSGVPVPATIWLVGAAVLGLMGVSRRKSRS